MAFHPQGGEFSDWLDLALADHALGRTDAAKAAAARARAARPSPKTGIVRERAESNFWPRSWTPPHRSRASEGGNA